MKGHALRVCVICFTLIFANIVAYSQASRDQLSEKEAFRLVRTINTVEATAFLQNHRYIPFQEVVQDKIFQGRQEQFNIENPDATSGTIKNYTVSILASSDGKHYAVQLSSAEQGCHPALFSNDSAIIYTAKAIDCGEVTFPAGSK